MVSIARIERPPFYRGGSASTETMPVASLLPFQARSFCLKGWGLVDLPLRVSNEGLLRPRVARAQKIISPHPLLLFVARLAARGWNPVALALLPQGFARKPEDLRAGRAAAVHSLQHR